MSNSLQRAHESSRQSSVSAIGAALQRAGRNPDIDRLYAAATAFLRQRRGVVARAIPDLAARIRADAALALALIEADGALNDMIEHYLLRVSADMRGVGHRTVEHQSMFADASSHAGQPAAADQIANGSHPKFVGCTTSRRSAISAAGRTVAKSLFDTVLIRDVAIGDLTYNQAKSFVRFSAREARILKFILNKVGVPADANAPLRRIATLKLIEQAVAKAGAA